MRLRLIVTEGPRYRGAASRFRVNWRGMERNKYAPWGRNAY
jgi:hypothetical protein